MTDAVKSYLVAVIAACMISVPAMLFVKKELPRRVVRLIGGLLILMVTLRPFLDFDTKAPDGLLSGLKEAYRLDTQKIRQDAQRQLADYVTQTAEKMIEQQAADFGFTLQAEVAVSKGEYPIPTGVKLIATATPEQVRRLSDYLEAAFGLSPERQEWKLYG